MKTDGAFSRARGFRNAGLAVLGFAVLCALLGAILPFPEIGVVAAQLRYFRAHRDDFDTLFIGSSLTHHNLSPASFDRIMAERGHPTRSFNFGVDGMLVAESSYVLERLLESKPSRLKWVVIEFDEINPRPFAGAEGSRRDIYWRDWRRTSLLVEKVLSDRGQNDSVEFSGTRAQVLKRKEEQLSTPRLLYFHLSLFGKNLVNFSRRTDLVWWGSHFWKPDKMPEDLGPNGDGYAPLAQQFPADRLPAYQFALEEARGNVGERVVSKPTQRACERMAREVRKCGATPVFLIMPVVSQTKLAFRPEAPVASVLAFNDARTYPQLYLPEVRAEEVHLNPKGAELMTTLLAEEMARLTDQKQLAGR